MPGMHAQRDLRILAVATEAALPDQHTGYEAPVNIAQLRLISGWHPRDCFTVKKNVKRPCAWPRDTEANFCFPVKKNVKRMLLVGGERRADGVPLRLVALAVCLDIPPVPQVLVHNPALEGRQRGELNRLARAQRIPGCIVSFCPQGISAALPISVGVVEDPHRRGALGKHDALGEMLDGVDRLAVATYEQTDI